jgi:hypothetical protein
MFSIVGGTNCQAIPTFYRPTLSLFGGIDEVLNLRLPIHAPETLWNVP